VCGDVLDVLDEDTPTCAVYSMFGAACFTDPSRLFPLVRERLAPGGRFVFSQPPAIPGAYGPQGMYKGGFAGKAQFTYRHSYKPAVWERFLARAASARSWSPPGPEPPGSSDEAAERDAMGADDAENRLVLKPRQEHSFIGGGGEFRAPP